MSSKPSPADRIAAHALTATSVRDLPVTGQPYTVRDTREGGFAIAVGGSGKKSFTVDFRVSGDRTKRRIVLGSFPAVTPEQARKQATSVKIDAQLRGVDQAKERKAVAVARRVDRTAKREARQAAREINAKTLRVCANRFMVDSAQRLRPSTAKLYRWLLDKHILEELGEKPITAITSANIAVFLAGTSRKETVANQCRRLLSTIFNYAERLGDRTQGTNPTVGAERTREHLKERYLKDNELERLLTALDTAETTGLAAAPWRLRKVSEEHQKHAPPPKPGKKNIARGEVLPANPSAVAALRLLVLTGARKSEVLNLKWSEVDLSRKIMTLEETKSGRSHRPLSPKAITILESVPRAESALFVFSSGAVTASGELAPIRDISRLWDAVRHAAGLREVRLHDLRHTAASLMLQRGASLAEVGRAIGHTSSRTTQRYAFISDDGAQRAASLLADAVESAEEKGRGSRQVVDTDAPRS